MSLSDYPGKQPIVVVFYRGFFGGIYRAQLVELQESYDAIQAADAEILAVSVNSQEDAITIDDLLNLSYPVLYDESTDVTSA